MDFTLLPTPVRIRRANNQVVQWCDIYIGRRSTQGGWNLPASIWANPYVVRQGTEISTVEQACTHYYWYVKGHPELLAKLPELEGKKIGCWCDITDRPLLDRLNHPQCHGEVLMRLVYESRFL
jgi:hypothetical protein